MDTFPENPGPHTLAIHAGEDPGADVAPPIHLATTYRFESAEAAAEAFQREDRPVYARWGNPTLALLEAKAAALEGGEAAVATASGMAAVSTALLTLLQAGDHVVASNALYSASRLFIGHDLARLGASATFVPADDPQAFADAIRPETKAFYLESPGNPTLALNDLQAIVDLARPHGVTTLIDNTFATPFNQRPLDLGVDVVIHSATKFFCGHSDALGGLVIGSRDLVQRARRGPLRNLGGVLSPFNAWLIARGMQTFPLRMARHNANALRIAEWLANHPQVAWVRYPYHPSHPQYDLARRQMRGGGGVVVFELKGSAPAGTRRPDRARLCTRAVSLGDTRILITHPASTTHLHIPPEIRRAAGISDGLVRLAVGLEDPEDLIADLEQALS